MSKSEYLIISNEYQPKNISFAVKTALQESILHDSGTIFSFF